MVVFFFFLLIRDKVKWLPGVEGVLFYPERGGIDIGKADDSE